MEISVCIVLMVVSLVVGGILTYFWLSRKYAQEISDLETQILEVQRKGNHYRENIEDKLLHAQNAAEDRKRELQAALLSQKNTENKYQQSQTQLKEKNTQLNDANAELKKLRKENDKMNKEKSALMAEKMTLLKEKETLMAENEFWLSEFDAKKDILMSSVSYESVPFAEAEEMESPFEAEQFEGSIENEYAEDIRENEEEEKQVDDFALLDDADKEEIVSEAELAAESVEMPQGSEQVAGEELVAEAAISSDEISTEAEEDTIIMAYPILTENEKLETEG